VPDRLSACDGLEGGRARSTAGFDRSIGAFKPNLIFDAGATISGSSSAASAYIRGIGQIDFALTTEPGVGIYLDGVYLSQSIGGVLYFCWGLFFLSLDGYRNRFRTIKPALAIDTSFG